MATQRDRQMSNMEIKECRPKYQGRGACGRPGANVVFEQEVELAINHGLIKEETDSSGEIGV